MAGKRVFADMDPDYEDMTEDQAKRQRIIEEDGTYEMFSLGLLDLESVLLSLDQMLNCTIDTRSLWVCDKIS